MLIVLTHQTGYVVDNRSKKSKSITQETTNIQRPITVIVRSSLIHLVHLMVYLKVEDNNNNNTSTAKYLWIIYE